MQEPETRWTHSARMTAIVKRTRKKMSMSNKMSLSLRRRSLWLCRSLARPFNCKGMTLHAKACVLPIRRRCSLCACVCACVRACVRACVLWGDQRKQGKVPRLCPATLLTHKKRTGRTRTAMTRMKMKCAKRRKRLLPLRVNRCHVKETPTGVP